MNDKVPFVRELFNKFKKDRTKDGLPLYNSDIIDFAKQVAEIHVTAALKAASNSELIEYWKDCGENDLEKMEFVKRTKEDKKNVKNWS